jgi:hypothetical protein
MNPIDPRLDRLLEAALKACPPVPEPSAWFEQRMIQSLRAEAAPFFAYLDGMIIFRSFIFAAVITSVSVLLPAMQVRNPYLETVDLATATTQMEQMR